MTPLYTAPPTICQVWSAPEVPSSDRTLCTGTTPSRISCDLSVHSFDHSSFTSNKWSPLQNIRSSNGPPSPSKLQIEIPVARRDSNAQANVHPLPLPPGAAMLSPRTPGPQSTPKSDLVPVKDQWQKGKLIGRGTFGSVYVASNK